MYISIVMEPDLDSKSLVDTKFPLYEFLQKDVLTDVTIITNDMNFNAHRIILATHCGYFRALFTTQLSAEKVVNLFEVSGSTMGVLLDMMYRRNLDLNDKNVCEVFIVADFLAFNGAVERCSYYLISRMEPSNCIQLYLFSRLYSVALLMKKAWTYILRHFLEVFEAKTEFLDLDITNLVAILQSDFINVSNEEKLWEAALAWMDHKESRTEYVYQLLSCVRLGLLQPSFLQKLKTHPILSGKEDCQTTIVEAQRIMFGLDGIIGDSSDGVVQEMNRPRYPHHIIFAIGGWSGGNPTNCLEAYDLRADSWASVNESDPLGPRAYHGTAVVGDVIFIIGGYNGYDYYNSCRTFNVVSRIWKDISPMNKNRCYVSVAVCGDFIYAMGGYNGQRRQNTAERYSIEQNQWTMIADMQCARSDASATSLNERIFIVGGFNGHECLSSVEFYDIKRNNWQFLTPMSERRSGVSCIGFGDALYVLGGFNGNARMNTVAKYDFRARNWVNVPSMIRARSNFAVATIEDTLYVIGGFNGTATTSEVESYSLEHNKWYQIQSLGICRSALSACVVSDFPTIEEYIKEIRVRTLEFEEDDNESDKSANSSLKLTTLFTRHFGQLGTGSRSVT